MWSSVIVIETHELFAERDHIEVVMVGMGICGAPQRRLRRFSLGLRRLLTADLNDGFLEQLEVS